MKFMATDSFVFMLELPPINNKFSNLLKCHSKYESTDVNWTGVLTRLGYFIKFDYQTLNGTEHILHF